MKIVYIAKHNSGHNDDEGAIAYALKSLGHEVVCVQENQGYTAVDHKDTELFLFHKWDDVSALESLEGKDHRGIKVFWYFDLVEWTARELRSRDARRINWMNRITPMVDLGFCTDGDWVRKDKTGKLHWLMQGFDERLTHTTEFNPNPDPPYDLFFPGNVRNAGRARKDWFNAVSARYGDKFRHAVGAFGKDLADEVNNCKIVVAPISPVKDYYWSNRIFNVLGLGGLLVHPGCAGLYKFYTTGSQYHPYKSLDDFFFACDYWLSLDRRDDALAVRENARQYTLTRHTYRHRCVRLLNTVREKYPWIDQSKTVTSALSVGQDS